MLSGSNIAENSNRARPQNQVTALDEAHVNLAKDRVLMRLSNIDDINEDVLFAQIIKQNGKPIDLTTARRLGLFQKNGQINESVKRQRNISIHLDFYFLNNDQWENVFQGFPEMDKLVAKAVIHTVGLELRAKLQQEVLEGPDSQANLSIYSASNQQRNASIQKQLEQLNDSNYFSKISYEAFHQGASSLKSTLANNEGVHPDIANSKSFAEFINNLRASGIWSFADKDESRIFNNIPMRPATRSLLKDLGKKVLQAPELLGVNLPIWFNKVLKAARIDLFTEDGDIHPALFQILPENIKNPDTDKAKRFLLTAYFSSVIGENATELLDKPEYREAA